MLRVHGRVHAVPIPLALSAIWQWCTSGYTDWYTNGDGVGDRYRHRDGGGDRVWHSHSHSQSSHTHAHAVDHAWAVQWWMISDGVGKVSISIPI